LPHRTTRQDCANAVEALLVHAYLNNLVSLEETVEQIATASDSPVEVFARLIRAVAEKVEGGKPGLE